VAAGPGRLGERLFEALLDEPVEVPTWTVRAMSSSVQPPSAASSTCARLSLRTAPLPPATSARSSCRSLSLKFTT
jgi:hypothetical protein